MKPQGDMESRQTVAALGVFDGVHLGHRRVLAQGVAMGSCNVVTFAEETMPEKQGRSMRYIYHDEQKRRLLTTCGADAVFALPFGELRGMDGETFCREILRDRLETEMVVCGENFRFGRRAACGPEELIRFGKKFGFGVKLINKVVDGENLPVSSRHIRFLLESGQITAANRLLGADYQLLLHVVTGRALGRELGVPTANQHFAPWQIVPHYGVYASFAEINDIWVPAITNIGIRPTVTGGPSEPVAETHLIDWSGELVGTLLPVTLVKFLRPEKRFDTIEDLTLQIRRDINTRKRLLPAEGKLSQD
jgi:riboflavin kinase/FMN adenylyltransferase